MTVLQLNGELHGDGDLDGLRDAFALVRPDDQLVIELSETTALHADSASLIHELLASRAAIGETVVVSPRQPISMRLVLHNVDRVSPIVPTMAHALNLLARPKSADELHPVLESRRAAWPTRPRPSNAGARTSFDVEE